MLVEDRYAIPLKFSITNTGHQPAFFVIAKTAAIVLPGGTSSKTIDNDVCDEYRKSSNNSGQTVFADQTIVQGGFESEDYPTFLRNDWANASNPRSIVMYGCVDYQFLDQPGHHQSRFSFLIGKAKDQGILARISELPADPTTVDIRLMPISIADETPAD